MCARVGFITALLCETDRCCPPVVGVGTPLDVAARFAIVDKVAHRLIGELCPLGKLPDACFFGSQVLKDRHVSWPDVVESELLEANLYVLHCPVVAGRLGTWLRCVPVITDSGSGRSSRSPSWSASRPGAFGA